MFILVAKSFFLPPLTLTLPPRRGERGKKERTFGNPYKRHALGDIFNATSWIIRLRLITFMTTR